MDETKRDTGTEPDQRPQVKGASRGTGDHRDAGDAGGSERSAASTEYSANAEEEDPADGQS